MVHDPARQVEQSVADRVPTGELSLRRSGVMVGPSVQVVSEYGAGHPGGVGEEPARRAVDQSGVVLQIADNQFHPGVFAVHPVGFCRREVAVGDEGVMSPVGPQPLLFLVGQAGASDYQAQFAGLIADLGGDGGLPHLRRPRLGLSNRLCEGLGSCWFIGLGSFGWGSGFRVG